MIYADTAPISKSGARRSCANGAEMPCGRRQPGGSRGSAFTFTASDPVPVEVGREQKCNRALNAGIPPPDQDQTVLPCAGNLVPMLLWALLASVRSSCARSMDGRRPFLSTEFRTDPSLPSPPGAENLQHARNSSPGNFYQIYRHDPHCTRPSTIMLGMPPRRSPVTAMSRCAPCLLPVCLGTA